MWLRGVSALAPEEFRPAARRPSTAAVRGPGRAGAQAGGGDRRRAGRQPGRRRRPLRGRVDRRPVLRGRGPGPGPVPGRGRRRGRRPGRLRPHPVHPPGPRRGPGGGGAHPGRRRPLRRRRRAGWTPCPSTPAARPSSRSSCSRPPWRRSSAGALAPARGDRLRRPAGSTSGACARALEDALRTPGPPHPRRRPADRLVDRANRSDP